MSLRAFGGFISRIFKRFDVLTRNKDTHATGMGGFLSLMLFAIAGLTLAVLISNPMGETEEIIDNKALNETTFVPEFPTEEFETNTRIRKRTVQRNMATDTSVHYVGSAGFSAAVRWHAYTNDWWSEDVEHDWVRVQDGSLYYLSYTDYCTSTYYPVDDWWAAYWQWVDYSACPTSIDYDLVLQGSYLFSPNYQFFAYQGNKCSWWCASEDNMRSGTDSYNIELHWIDTYYDESKDPSSPISDLTAYYLGRSYYDKLMDIVLFVKETQIVYLDGTTESVYAVSRIVEQQTDNTDQHVQIAFFLEYEYDIIEQYEEIDVVSYRRNLDITTTTTYTNDTISNFERDHKDGMYQVAFVLGQVGGFFAFLHLVCSLLVSTCERKVYEYESVNKYNKLVNSHADPYDVFQFSQVCQNMRDLEVRTITDESSNSGPQKPGNGAKGSQKPDSEFIPLVNHALSKKPKGKKQTGVTDAVTPGAFYHGEQLPQPKTFEEFWNGRKRAPPKNRYSCCDFLYYLTWPLKCSWCRRRSSKSFHQKFVEFETDLKNFERDKQDPDILAKLYEVQLKYKTVYDALLRHEAEKAARKEEEVEEVKKVEAQKPAPQPVVNEINVVYNEPKKEPEKDWVEKPKSPEVKWQEPKKKKKKAPKPPRKKPEKIVPKHRFQ